MLWKYVARTERRRKNLDATRTAGNAFHNIAAIYKKQNLISYTLWNNATLHIIPRGYFYMLSNGIIY